MIRFRTNRIWKGERVECGDEVWGTEKEKQALLDCGQAYEDEPQTPTMDNTKKEIEQYLQDNDIEFSEYSTKAELLELI